ncbi:class I SAM-dependent methyltransferase [Pseudogemmobacter sonorensis]|uniref:class I SAM-dependent methyltransferase n=1 Tax=Pseudogemmobacter sonorensis TaxID=2989681 RepID=UPI003691BB96
MTALAAILARRIRETGPMTLAEYMTECLLHPRHGYYATRDPFGTGGDFITAPEISQMFGELLGLALAQYWLDLGTPAPFTLAETGPGRGTLMADVLRATRGVPGFHAAARVALVEASAHLRGVQAQVLADYPVEWLPDAAALPEGPLFLLANEFFDALPIRQFTRRGGGWSETMVGLSETGALGFGHAPPLPLAALEPRLTDLAEGDTVEICPAAVPVMQSIAGRVARHGGLALIVDYGDWHSRGDTFQALRAHRYIHPLSDPGAADLTAHVDFAALARAAGAAGAACAYTTQGDLLNRLGLPQRAAKLAERLTGGPLEAHLAAVRRLTAAQEMGTLFKALAVHPPGAPPPPGFP